MFGVGRGKKYKNTFKNNCDIRKTFNVIHVTFKERKQKKTETYWICRKNSLSMKRSYNGTLLQRFASCHAKWTMHNAIRCDEDLFHV